MNCWIVNYYWILQESAELPEIDSSAPGLSRGEEKLRRSGILKDARKENLPDKISQKQVPPEKIRVLKKQAQFVNPWDHFNFGHYIFLQKRNFVRREADTLIDGLFGAVRSGDILKNLRQVCKNINLLTRIAVLTRIAANLATFFQDKKKGNKFEFNDPGVVEYGHYLQGLKKHWTKPTARQVALEGLRGERRRWNYNKLFPFWSQNRVRQLTVDNFKLVLH